MTAEVYCIACGIPLPGEARFCWRCGTPTPGTAALAMDGAGAADEPVAHDTSAPGSLRAAAQRGSAQLAARAGRVTLGAAVGAASGAATGAKESLVRGTRPAGASAGLLPRLLAGAVDAVIVGSALIGAGALVGGALALVLWLTGAQLDLDRRAVAAIVLAGAAAATFYEPAFLAAAARTPGKLAAGLRVERADGRPIRFLRAYARQALRALSLLPLGLGVAWIAWDPRRQAWHDHLTGTVVVVDPSREWRRPTAPATTDDGD